MKTHLLAVAAIALSTMPAFAMSDNELYAALEQRFKGDHTGACVAAAVIDNGATARAYFCADPRSQRPYDEHTAFEIGSVTKTMTAALLAEFIARGEVALNDPIAKLLPPGTSVPSFEGREITIGDVVTHTSGLPSFPWHMTNMDNPFAAFTESDLLGALAATRLTRAPGSQWEYSNFAMMVLSYALAKRSGKDYETLLRERLLAPLAMNETYIAKRPPQVRLAQGHLSNTMPQVPWDFPVDMAGVGGVRATLPDMVRYLEGELGTRESEITPALARTQQQVASLGPPGDTMGMNWIIQSTANGHTIVAHAGGTGGYSSLAAFDRAAKRAVVLLSDTALTTLGGFGTLGLHLLDPAVPVGAPRIVAAADAKLIDALVGRYRLPGGLGLDLRHKGDALTLQADGQPEFEMGYDSAGDFYPLQFDALLRPKRKADGTYIFTWFQLGAALEAERIGASALDAATVSDYVGKYRFNFGILDVALKSDHLEAQLTGQPAFPIFASAKDKFFYQVVDAQLDFERDVGGKVIAVILHQNGRDMRAPRMTTQP
jgi:serine-type D-Ala-D-Ala carboxypeptidase/endopeptidase